MNHLPILTSTPAVCRPSNRWISFAVSSPIKVISLLVMKSSSLLMMSRLTSLTTLRSVAIIVNLTRSGFRTRCGTNVRVRGSCYFVGATHRHKVNTLDRTTASKYACVCLCVRKCDWYKATDITTVINSNMSSAPKNKICKILGNLGVQVNLGCEQTIQWLELFKLFTMGLPMHWVCIVSATLAFVNAEGNAEFCPKSFC